jgi:carbon-monoxide dehydrogenase medium subunit
MKPAPFEYIRPQTVEEAVRALALSANAKIMAGGQTLGPMLNLRLARPELIVDVTRIAELAAVSEERDAVVIGATVTHAAIEDGRVPDPTHGFLQRVAQGIAYRAVRTRGTIGGSVAHGDPAADWLSALTALGADVVVAGPAGRRQQALAEFVRGAMQTELGADEVLVGVRVPRFSRSARFAFHKICRRTGEFAEAIGVVVDDPERSYVAMVAGATAGKPIILPPLINGNGMAESGRGRVKNGMNSGKISLEQLSGLLKAAQFDGDDYDVRLHAVALKRAWDEAWAA